MELASKYNPAEVEGKWYQFWEDNKLFASKPDAREPYTIVIPPPNVTGVLHMGHMLNETIQDILIRKARMDGKNACWVPGTDHASIATEAKVVGRLAERGVKKTDLTREEFLKHAWDWTHEHGGIILKQLRRLGASCDWDRTSFTMDEERSKSVIKVFVDLYRKGLIYRGVRMVNWDPKAQTALSDEEVIYKEEHSKLYYLKYRLAEGEEVTPTGAEGEVIYKDEKGYYAVVATTRPETIMGDTAMCINPNDAKNRWLSGKKVVVPLVNRTIPVIEDDYVDVEFGTGCLKVTPAHDVNDYMLGDKHQLETIDIFNDDGTLSEAAGLYIGMDRFDVRVQIEKDLLAAGLMEKVEPYTNKVGCSERTGVAIEPKLSMQWFLSMQHFADLALPPVMNDEIKFYPTKYKVTYKNWLENIKDWCISRQLWWGHRIPAWYLPKGGFVVAENAEEALALAKQQSGDESLTVADLHQDEDALDTWFSSWLWPISLFKGINEPGNEEIKYYYPTSVLVTGPDIIFFWVARMIMAGYEYMGDMPFKSVYFTGIVRDKLGRKMSKSLGNSPDPLMLIDQYGADGVRMGMLLSAPAGNDILFDEKLCQNGMAFCNKIWNAFRLIQGWETADIAQPESSEKAIEWFDAQVKASCAEIEDLYAKYRLSEALMAAFKLFTDEFSGWYLEMIKPAYLKPIDKKTYQETLRFFDILMKVIHPFMPFITEEIWQHVNEEREAGNVGREACGVKSEACGVKSIMTENLKLDAPSEAEKKLLADAEVMKQIVAGVRAVRNQKNIAPKELMELEIVGKNPVEAFTDLIVKMANLSDVKVVAAKGDGSSSFMVGTTEFAVPLGNLIDTEAEIQKMEAELKHLEGFLMGVKKKLSNERFVANAPAQVVELERKKQSDAETKIAALKESIQKLK
ncbi:MAG: valine--tRNA ligase [Bacteroidaceae bacterium]|nr:valine--tRNA ligase [Bacteroidaceae bacterium]